MRGLAIAPEEDAERVEAGPVRRLPILWRGPDGRWAVRIVEDYGESEEGVERYRWAEGGLVTRRELDEGAKVLLAS